MRRVSVVGTCSGVGKTTLGRDLARRLAVPFVELDALFWQRDWTQTPTDEFRSLVDDASRREAWVVDGNYTGRLGDLIWQRADTVVWLDLPLRVAVWRTLARTVRRALTREELWGGNRENLVGALLGRDALLVYAVRTYRRRRRLLEERIASGRYPHLAVHRFVAARDADLWLGTVEERPAHTAVARA